MAPSRTTTLRVPQELRDEIAQLAEARGSTMLDVVTDAVHRLRRDQWWDDLRAALDGLDGEERQAYAAEASQLEASVGDGLGPR